MGIVWTVFSSNMVTLDASATESSNAFSLVEES